MNNDLISRKALKKALKEMFDTVEVMLFDDIIATIDNASTVSFMISPDYVTELQNHNKELIKQLEEMERPQGEWITDNLHNTICNKCGGIRRDNRVEYIAFCNKCGADMRKGGAE